MMLLKRWPFLKFSYLKRTVVARSQSTIRACIIGAGPAGYYTAQKLLKGNESIHIDLIDKLPVPFGLVRFGVAPDHPEVKNVINTFTQTATNFRERFKFVGNVEVGRDVHMSDLQKYYDVVVLSYGAENDRKLGIPGEDARGVYSAREFVGWYNGVPEFSNLAVDLSNTKCAVILGQGNVALDIARLLLMPIDELAKTDICQHALDVIAGNKLSSIHIVGRRGPLQAAFTIKEFRELTKLPGVQAHISSSHMNDISISDLPRPRRRLTELMKKIAESSLVADYDRSWHLDFLLTPLEILTGSGHVTTLRCAKNRLVGEDITGQKSLPTDETLDIPCDMVIRSIGYQSLTVDGVPFDVKTYTIPNTTGRVLNTTGLYCSGWVKRGPVGVIATTMTDAFETADTILDDINSGRISDRGAAAIDWIRSLGKPVVDFPGWEKIDEEEVERGNKKGKPREKLTDVGEMLEIAK